MERIGQGLKDVFPVPEDVPTDLSTVLRLYRQIELTRQELTEAQSESRKLVAHVQHVLAQSSSAGNPPGLATSAKK